MRFPQQRQRFGQQHFVDPKLRGLVTGLSVEEHAPHERMEEHHVLIGAGVEIEFGVGGAPPAAQARADGRFGGAVFGSKPVVQTVNPTPQRRPEIRVRGGYHFLVDNKREEKISLEL